MIFRRSKSLFLVTALFVTVLIPSFFSLRLLCGMVQAHAQTSIAQIETKAMHAMPCHATQAPDAPVESNKRITCCDDAIDGALKSPFLELHQELYQLATLDISLSNELAIALASHARHPVPGKMQKATSPPDIYLLNSSIRC